MKTRDGSFHFSVKDMLCDTACMCDRNNPLCISLSFSHSLSLSAKDVAGKRPSIYPILSGAPAVSWHPSAVPHEPKGHQVPTPIFLRVHSLTLQHLRLLTAIPSLHIIVFFLLLLSFLVKPLFHVPVNLRLYASDHFHCFTLLISLPMSSCTSLNSFPCFISGSGSCPFHVSVE